MLTRANSRGRKGPLSYPTANPLPGCVLRKWHFRLEPASQVSHKEVQKVIKIFKRSSVGHLALRWGKETTKIECLSATSHLKNLRWSPGEQNDFIPTPTTLQKYFQYFWKMSLTITVSCSIGSVSPDGSPPAVVSELLIPRFHATPHPNISPYNHSPPPTCRHFCLRFLWEGLYTGHSLLLASTAC